ncbi:MAG: stage II sporulation protein E [Tissierellaceae bacterium]|nr:stage II sporulation protein E [Tissierellaceae bacterium]
MIKIESIAKRKIDLNIGKEEVLLLLFGFLISRVSISGRLAPFGIGFLSAYLLIKGNNIYVLLSIILGSLSHSGIKGLDYVLASVLIYIIFTKIKEAKESTLIRSSIISSLVFLITRLSSTLLFREFYIYDIFVLLFEGILVFTFGYIFSFSIPLDDFKNKGFSSEKLVCTFITLSLVLSGLSSIWFFGLSLQNIISIVIIVYLGYNQGVLLGTVSGCVLGLIIHIGNPEMPFIVSILSVGGLLAGLFRDLGRAGSLLGFMLGNGIISFYINKLGTSFLDYRELFIGSIVFLGVTQFIKVDLTKYFDYTTMIEKEYENKKEEFIIKKLENMSDLFIDLSKILNKAIEEDEAYSALDVYNLVDEISNSTCANCKSFEVCWENDYYTSYYKLLNLIGVMELGNENEDVLINKIKGTCEKGEELIKNINGYLIPLKNNQIWNNKLNEQRRLLVDQLHSFGDVVENITEEIYTKPLFSDELRVLLINEIKNNRVPIVDLSVIQLPEDSLEILIEMRNPINNTSEIEKVRNIISEAIGFNVSTDYVLGNKVSSKIIKFKKENRFSTLTDVTTLANSENKVSGDSYAFGVMENLNFTAISDGMGIGKKANRESSVAIELLEKLMEINMDKSMIIRTINSFLRAKSNDEIFTTLDLGFIDLYTGKLQIIKNGSPSTFIKRKDRVDVISSKSLPIGILEDVDTNIYEEYLEDGDILIMMSDGVLDCNRSEENSVEWMKQVIMGINSQNPKRITEEIKNIARFVSNNRPKDDMTIMATKIWRTI